MNSLIESIEQLAAMPYASEVYTIEKNDVRSYKVIGLYPTKSFTAVLLTYGTNEGCSRWISKMHIESRRFFTDYQDAVKSLVTIMEADLEAVKRIYLKGINQ